MAPICTGRSLLQTLHRYSMSAELWYSRHNSGGGGATNRRRQEKKAVVASKQTQQSKRTRDGIRAFKNQRILSSNPLVLKKPSDAIDCQGDFLVCTGKSTIGQHVLSRPGMGSDALQNIRKGPTFYLGLLRWILHLTRLV